MTRLWKRSILHVNSSKVIFSQNDIDAVNDIAILKKIVWFIFEENLLKNPVCLAQYFLAVLNEQNDWNVQILFCCVVTIFANRKSWTEKFTLNKKIDMERDVWMGWYVCEIKENKWDKDALCLKQVNLHAIWNQMRIACAHRFSYI